MSHKVLGRFHGYDYAMCGGLIEPALSDGEEIVTVTLAERRPLFGRVVCERVELSNAGEIV